MSSKRQKTVKDNEGGMLHNAQGVSDAEGRSAALLEMDVVFLDIDGVLLPFDPADDSDSSQLDLEGMDVGCIMCLASMGVGNIWECDVCSGCFCSVCRCLLFVILALYTGHLSMQTYQFFPFCMQTYGRSPLCMTCIPNFFVCHVCLCVISSVHSPNSLLTASCTGLWTHATNAANKSARSALPKAAAEDAAKLLPSLLQLPQTPSPQAKSQQMITGKKWAQLRQSVTSQMAAVRRSWVELCRVFIARGIHSLGMLERSRIILSCSPLMARFFLRFFRIVIAERTTQRVDGASQMRCATEQD